MQMRQELDQLKQQIEKLKKQAPAWLAAQDALTQLCEQTRQSFDTGHQVTEYMQQRCEDHSRNAVFAASHAFWRSTSPTIELTNL